MPDLEAGVPIPIYVRTAYTKELPVCLTETTFGGDRAGAGDKQPAEAVVGNHGDGCSGTIGGRMCAMGWGISSSRYAYSMRRPL
jgi:hypothetical protein